MGKRHSDIDAIDSEMKWIKERISIMLDNLTLEEEESDTAEDAPGFSNESNYGNFMLKEKMGAAERIIIALSLARALSPDVFLDLIESYTDMEQQTYFGGYFDKDAHAFYPTVMTAVFLAAGKDQRKKQELLLSLHSRHPLFLQNIIYAESSKDPASQKEVDFIHCQLRIAPAYLRYFLGGAVPRLDEDPGFPAYLSTTGKKFEDVVLPPQVREQLEDPIKYIKHKSMAVHLTGEQERWRSYVVIFSGFPGTGKTLTATTIGKMWNIPVYIVNQAQLVSKYVGETQKHLEKLFNRFDSHDCILFFDEADAIFGKRVDVKSSNDHHVNQDIAYLLQRVASFNGLIILATNVHDVEGTFDKAFQRRFKRHIHFRFPDYAERLQLWEKAMPEPFRYEDGLLEDLSKYYQINGSSIENIVSDVIIEAIDQDVRVITSELIDRFLKLDYKRRKMPFERYTDEEIFDKPVLRYGQGMPASTREFEGIDEKLRLSRQVKTLN